MDLSGILRQSVRGHVVTRQDPDYDHARRVFNTMVDRRPLAVVRCADAEDVVRCVRFAAEHDLPLSVRAGGHSAAGHSVCDDGLVVDLCALNRVVVDPRRAVAEVGGGATWAELDRATGAHGLAVPGGTVSSTGVGGLTLGGGLGWLLGKYGLTCDNLIGAEVVTANGERTTTSAARKPDLLWALRGGGGNFGVVTCFVFRLHEVRTVLAGSLVLPLERASRALRVLRELSDASPDELTVSPALTTTASGDRLLSIDLCHVGDPKPGARLVGELVRRLAPARNTVARQPYPQWQRFLDPAFATPMRGYWKSCFLDDLNDDVVRELVRAYAETPSKHTTIILEHFHGAMTRIAPTATAYSQRNRRFSALLASRWASPADDQANIAWATALNATLTTNSDGAGYLNYMGAEDQRTVRAFYGEGALHRLEEIKRRYDPHNLFRHNQNVPPNRTRP
jgi:FAD/FMN-containing dehydrogenase